jgi:hypothetical protein
MNLWNKAGPGLAILSLLYAAEASAHHPTITAEATCVDGAATINYVSTSWSPNQFEGENPLIQILVNGVVADDGAYVFPGNSFSGTVPAPADDTAVVTAYAAANWGNGAAGGQSASTTVSIPEDCPTLTGDGRFTGGGHQIRVDNVRVTRGLTVHCDLLLSNNLEINWLGNQFHMTEHLSTVACTDNPAIIQAPPAAPLDTLIGVGSGRYNGADGFTIEFTLVDGGEPGVGVDSAALRVYETAAPGNVVLNVPLQLITGGNLQAHYDQPHK